MLKTIIRKKDLNPNMYVSEGNKKLVENDREFFLIWNLPSVKTCPWRTPMCEHFCYAKGSEKLYKDCLPCRERNLQESKKDTFIQDMDKIIQWHKTRPSKKGKQIYFRIHESGDFYSLDYLRKFIAIAISHPDVIFTAYTKSVTYIAELSNIIPSNMVIRFSLWDDTKPEYKALAEQLGLPIYTAFEPSELENKVKNEGFIKCDCDCKKCKMCYHVEYKKIAVAIH